MAAKTSIRGRGRPKKLPPGEKKLLDPPYSKELVLEAISRSEGFVLGVQLLLRCCTKTATAYIKKWPETELAFELARIPAGKKAIEKFLEAVDRGEQWAIDRMLRRMPEEGLSPDKPERVACDTEAESRQPTQIIFKVIDAENK
jgi:hypothetical protein